MKINTKRLWDHIMELGKIGSGADGSVTRFPFTPEDKSAEKLICRYMEEELKKPMLQQEVGFLGIHIERVAQMEQE